ncbi:MAG: serine hydrolase [Myxococcota bacterium]|nr:serine hydrolase [Deltaproteobacteria bacterium]MDQ3334140.1 serine hydrolase [Myxococcota bacterium]
MLKQLLLVALVACKAGGTGSGPALPPPGPKPAPALQIEAGLLPAVQVKGDDTRFALEARMREYKIPAISVAVFENYEVVWAKAYGFADVEGKTPATEETTFLAGSISKSVNALAQLLAVEEGLIDLDAPINEALKSWKLPENDLTRVKPVTLQMLLSHTGGTTVHGFRGYASREKVPTIEQILEGKQPANSAPIRVDLAPGSKFRYSGGGTTITQLALEEKSKKPYAEVLAARVLAPIGMTNSSFEQELGAARLVQAAAGYGPDGKAIDGKRFVYPEMAAAGLWTTPTDLARFFIEIAKARTGKSKVVSEKVAKRMTTKVADAEPVGGVGLGVFLSERNAIEHFGHNGADAGFQAIAIASLEGGRGIVVMTNSENGHRIFPEIERTIFAAYEWPGADAPIVRFRLEGTVRLQFVGRFVADGTPVEIVERGNELHARMPFGESAELVPTAPDNLVKVDDGTQIKLTANGLEAHPRNRPPQLLVRNVTEHPLFLLEASRFDEAVAALKATKDPKAEEARNNQLGYALLGRAPAKAVDVFRLNTTAFADSANAHDSLGEAYAKNGNKAAAITAYERALGALAGDARIPAGDKPAFKTRVDAELAKLRAR